MPEADEDVQRLSPDRLMTAFSRSHIALCLIVALGLHIAVVAATSMTYIRDRWIDPEGAELRRIAEERQREARKAAQRRAREARRAAATQRAGSRPAGWKDDVPARGKKSPVYRATTQRAAPGEIPKAPEDMTVPLE